MASHTNTFTSVSRYVAEPPGINVHWSNLAYSLKMISEGKDIAYSGAAAEYTFIMNELNNGYGVARQRVIDAWEIRNNRFEYTESIGAYCTDKLADQP